MVNIVEKGWGREIIFANNDDYCGKLLCFDKAGSKGSMHFHVKKKETWYVQQGSFKVLTVDPKTAKLNALLLRVGDTLTNDVGQTHQLEALEENSIIFEVSTKDDPNDSYRVIPGDSQL